MRIGVLTSPDNWYFQDLLRAAQQEFELQPISYKRLAARLVGQQQSIASDLDLKQFDAVLVRAMPLGTLEQVIFRMDALGQHEASGGLVVNSARAIECAVDKYLTTAKLQAAGLLVPKTMVCQSSEDALEAFDLLGGDVVLKPIFGSEGRGIARITDADLASRAFRMVEQLGGILYLQEFVPHLGQDWRVLVIGEKTLGMQRASTIDWRTNISRGATATKLQVGSELEEMALTAAQAVGAKIAGVDFLPGKDGHLYAIEVNAVPGWKALATSTEIDVANEVLQFLKQQVQS